MSYYCVRKPSFLMRFNYHIQAQSSGAIIQPGFLSYHVVSASPGIPLPLVEAFPARQDRKPGWITAFGDGVSTPLLDSILMIHVIMFSVSLTYFPANHDGSGGPRFFGFLLDSFCKRMKYIYLKIQVKYVKKASDTYGCTAWWCADSWAAASCTRGSSSPGHQIGSWGWSSPCSAPPDRRQTSSCSPGRGRQWCNVTEMVS